MQMIILMDWPLANDHPDRPASCKWSSGLISLLQMLIRMERPLANDYQDGPASFEWPSRSTGLLQIIIWIDRPLANDHQDRLASCTWSFGSTGTERTQPCWKFVMVGISLQAQMIIQMDRPFANDHSDGLASCKCSSYSLSIILLLRKKHIFLPQIFSSFSSTMNLLPCNNIFPVSKFIPKFSFPVLFSSEKVYFPSPNIISLFHLRIISPQQKHG